MNINWEDLRYFLAAAESGSLSAAAKALNSNQPTVGRHVDALEHALGVKLFQRHKHGLTLTQEGAAVLEQSRLMRSGIQNIVRVSEGDHRQPEGSVSLALPEGLCNEILVPHLAVFSEQYPGLRLTLHVSPRSANLARGEAEIAIRLFRPKEADLVVRQLTGMEMGLYASEEYLRDRGEPQHLAELSRHRIIAYGEALAALPENRLLLDWIAPESAVLRSDSTTTRLKATTAGLGISIQPCMVAAINASLVRVVADARLPSHEVWITYHRDLRNVPRVAVVADFLVAIFSGGGGAFVDGVSGVLRGNGGLLQAT
jgi:DNA-binding transcriptional LysR family regulator